MCNGFSIQKKKERIPSLGPRVCDLSTTTGTICVCVSLFSPFVYSILAFLFCWSILKQIFVVWVQQTAVGNSVSLRYKNEMQPTGRATMFDWHTWLGVGMGCVGVWVLAYPCKHCTFGLSKANAGKILFWPTTKVFTLTLAHTGNLFGQKQFHLSLKMHKKRRQQDDGETIKEIAIYKTKESGI